MNTRGAVVYIVEDDPSFRKSVERLIRVAGYDVVAFESAGSFLAQHSIRQPGCLLLDVQLPGIDGLSLQQKLTESGINLPIIFMTGHGTIPMSVQAMKRGAVDFLPKPVETRNLLSAVAAALERAGRNVREALELSRITALFDTLSSREKEVMRWIITGKLNKQIAYALGIAEKTVKVHRSRVMQKLKVSSVAELVRLAAKANIAPAD
jgi:FixJ family two-component response regulator